MEYFLVNLHGSGPSFFITIQLVFFFQLLNKQEHSPQKLESNVLWASAKQLVLKVLRRRYNLQTITNDISVMGTKPYTVRNWIRISSTK